MSHYLKKQTSSYDITTCQPMCLSAPHVVQGRVIESIADIKA